MATLGYAIVGVILINGLFSFWQEYRAEKALAALRNLLRGVVVVLSDGKDSGPIGFRERYVSQAEVIDRALQVAREADVLIAVGSTLQVYPVAGAVPLAKRTGAKLVILNAQATQFDDIADVVLNTSIGEALPYLFGP